MRRRLGGWIRGLKTGLSWLWWTKIRRHDAGRNSSPRAWVLPNHAGRREDLLFLAVERVGLCCLSSGGQNRPVRPVRVVSPVVRPPSATFLRMLLQQGRWVGRLTPRDVGCSNGLILDDPDGLHHFLRADADLLPFLQDRQEPK